MKAYITNYKELKKHYPLQKKLRAFLRNSCVFILSNFASTEADEWIRIPMYHHVFDDEINGFRRQLQYMQNIGEFISLDYVWELLNSNEKLSGRYFSITFDDGFKNCYRNALSVIKEYGAQAAYFIPTDYIGLSIENDAEKLESFYSTTSYAYPKPVQFLTWQDCADLVREGMIIGAHSCSHLTLRNVDKETAKKELSRSKKTIEQKLGVECKYFAPAQGHAGVDFDVSSDIELAKEIGYKLFLANDRGLNLPGSERYMLFRDHLIAQWGNYQLKYFFG